MHACKAVAAQLSLPVVDAFAALGGESEERAASLRDGLHLSQAGNEALFGAIQVRLSLSLSLSLSLFYFFHLWVSIMPLSHHTLPPPFHRRC